MKENIIMAMQKALGGWFIVIFLLVACTQEDDGKISNDKLITFSSHLSEITSRSLTDDPLYIHTKESWLLNDTIGVFYTKTDSEYLSDESIVNGVRNFKYVSTKYGVNTIFTFATDRDKFYYSYNNTPNNFLAYYPYTSAVSEKLIYPIDIKDQSNLSKIDLLLATTSESEIFDDAIVPLTFKHQLSKLILNLSDEDSRYYNNMKVTAKGFYTKANFLLVDKSIAGRTGELDVIDVIVNPHRIEMLIIPQGVMNGYMSFKWQEGYEAKWNITNKVFEAGKKYEYSLHLDFPNVKVLGESISEWKEGGIYSIGSEKPELDTKIDVLDDFLVKITGNTYPIGSPQGVGLPNEWPQHDVGIGTFWITPHEITNEQYVLFLNKTEINGQLISGNGHKLLNGAKEISFNDVSGKWISMTGREHYPVTNVTWYGAAEFARWLGGDLPTEGEWETACRAESKGLFSFDNSNSDNIRDYVNCKERDALINNTKPGTMPVKSLKSNKYGLYDMHGNVSEWCLDAVERTAEGSSASYNTQKNIILEPNDETTYHTIRGGSWKSFLEECRSAFRNCLLPIAEATLLDDVGFRVVFPIKNILYVNVKDIETVMSLEK
ncbi:Serine/threonine-protein kinase pkn1 [termite gut metagenome]|uniref:Serine/threonine-protein kinase pkn1 n=1 Tax=termite gut metagenome TaxID=433724 RepID=A0A5J4T3W4_9ZZZZ